jgi:hypothetical protein
MRGQWQALDSRIISLVVLGVARLLQALGFGVGHKRDLEVENKNSKKRVRRPWCRSQQC